jgi:hypothetical protein
MYRQIVSKHRVPAQQEHHPQCQSRVVFPPPQGVCNGFTIDMSGVRDRKHKMVSGMNEMYLENYRKTGAECLHAQTRCEEI